MFLILRHELTLALDSDPMLLRHELTLALDSDPMLR